MNIFRKCFSWNTSLRILRSASRVQARSGSNVGKAICICEAPKLDNQEVLMKPKDALEKHRHEGQLTVCGPSEISPIAGMPLEHLKSRRVRIYKMTKHAMQSGTETAKGYRVVFETRERWENPLMGWASSGDPLGGTILWFPTEKEAIVFCEKNSWRWFLEHRSDRPVKKALRPGPYSSNYSWDKRTRTSTK